MEIVSDGFSNPQRCSWLGIAPGCLLGGTGEKRPSAKLKVCLLDANDPSVSILFQAGARGRLANATGTLPPCFVTRSGTVSLSMRSQM